MRRFELLEPRSLQEACGILAEREDVRPIAGGTALLILIKQGIYIPTTLLNLKKIKGASDLSFDPERGLRVGALTSIYDLETSPVIREHYPVLAYACHVVANVRIRNMATIGGNLAHADYQSDPPAALIALGARVELTSHEGSREVKLADFLLGSYETALRHGELLSALLVPPLPPDIRGSYIKFTSCSSEDRPCVGVVAMVRVEKGVCREARLVVGAVSPKPVRVSRAEKLSQEKKLTPEVIEEMAVEASRVVDPIDDLRGSADYKRHVIRVLARRALSQVANEGGRA